MGVMTAYVLQVNMNTNKSPEHDLATTYLFWIALLLLIVLTLRELFQMALSYRR